MDDYFFEGAEKLLEIWFGDSKNNDEDRQEKSSSSSAESDDNNSESSGDEQDPQDGEEHGVADLRKIPRAALESVLKLVKCEIMSFKRSEALDAYVLSESSMFISRDRFIVKTCGSTALLRCLEPLIYLAKEVAGFDEILDVFYSRKNFLRPELQDEPHRHFTLETELLDSYFEDGAAYCMGRMNNDHWYFYTLAPMSAKSISAPDQTLEVLMHNLDPAKMAIFTKAISMDGKDATLKAGIDKLIPGTVIDDYLFSPCGYSMNGLIRGGYYMTIHITPEEGFSYVSFETNYPHNNYADLVGRVVKTFLPGTFMVTLLANDASKTSPLKVKDFHANDSFTAFKMREMQSTKVKNYELTYVSFAKAPS